MHPPLEIRPPGLNVEAGFSRSKRHIIIFPVQRPSVSRHGLTLELRPPIRRLVSCRELITIYTGQRCVLYTANSSSVLINEKFGGGWRTCCPHASLDKYSTSNHFVSRIEYTFLIFLVLEALAMPELRVARVPDADLEDYRSHPKSPTIDHARVVQHCDQIIFFRSPQAFL